MLGNISGRGNLAVDVIMEDRDRKGGRGRREQG